jgi:hypothetical protein
MAPCPHHQSMVVFGGGHVAPYMIRSKKAFQAMTDVY